MVLSFFVDGVNFRFHKGFFSMAEAVAAAIAATLSIDNGTPAYASIWDDEEHLAVAIIRNGEVFLNQDRGGE